jgi:hypothetical protein
MSLAGYVSYKGLGRFWTFVSATPQWPEQAGILATMAKKRKSILKLADLEHCKSAVPSRAYTSTSFTAVGSRAGIKDFAAMSRF